MSAVAGAGITLRPFEERDYPALAALQRAVHDDFADTEDEIRRAARIRPAHIRAARFVAETAADQVVASAEYDQEAGRYEPGRFAVWVDVHPDHRRQGVGTALWNHLSQSLAAHSPRLLETYVREHNEAGLRFAEQRGFAEARRTFPSEVDLAVFDLTPWDDRERRLSAGHGVTIRTAEELADDPDRLPKLHTLCEAIRADFPSDAPATPQSYETWHERFWNDPKLVRDAYHVAVAPDGMTYIGYNSLVRDDEEPTRLWTQQTGVVRAWRRKGIATALKVRGMRWGKANGFAILRTFNDSTNAGMLAVNDLLGFRRLAAWIFLKNVLKEENNAS